MPSRLRPCRSIPAGPAVPPPQLPGKMDADSPQTRPLSRSGPEPPYCVTSLPWQRGWGLAWLAAARGAAADSRVRVSPRAVPAACAAPGGVCRAGTAARSRPGACVLVAPRAELLRAPRRAPLTVGRQGQSLSHYPAHFRGKPCDSCWEERWDLCFGWRNRLPLLQRKGMVRKYVYLCMFSPFFCSNTP